MVVAESSFEVSEPTIDSHIVKLKSSGADVFFNVAIVTLVVGSAWETLGREPWEAAATLGAGPWRRLRELTLAVYARAEAIARERPEVLEAHRLAGDIDYILKVRVKNARAYDTFYQALISEVRIYNVTALLSMEEIKSTTVLPL